jgi:uncharacterized protein YaiL (DUF2058 family)
MADLRDQLRKAGLVSEKQVRQAKHKERVHATETGRDGLADERRNDAERLRSERKERKAADRRRQKERLKQQSEEESARRLRQLIESGSIRDAAIGTKRFFFPTRSNRITYLDLSETAVRKLICGKAAIVDLPDQSSTDFRVISDRAAGEIEQIDRSRILFWNEGGPTR